QGSTVTLSGVEVLDTHHDDDGEFGRGISVQGESSLITSDCVLQGNHELGVYLAGSTATLESTRVLDTRTTTSGQSGRGIHVQEQSSLVATDCLVQGNHEAGLFVSDSNTTLSGVQVLDTQPDTNGTAGRGIGMAQGTLVATDCVIQGNHEVGLAALGSTVSLEGVQVLDTQPNASGQLGRGINVQEQSTLVATDCLVQGNREVGVYVDDSTATLSSVQVLDTRRGILATAVGLTIQANASAEVTDLTVQHAAGPALSVLFDSTMSCTDCTLTDSAFAGAVLQWGGQLVLEDSLIEGTVSDSSAGGGLGVFVDDRLSSILGLPTLTLLNSTVRDNDLGAVYIKGAGTYQLTGNDLSGGGGLTVAPGGWLHGDALFVTTGEESPSAWDEAEQVGLLLQDNTFSDSAGAGIFLDGASATLSDNTYEGNATDLVRQACSETDAPEGLDDESLSTTQVCPNYDYLTQEVLLVSPYLEEAEAEY
ncbi:MAG: right-handed parallel beta-helix repeat-containing protein, partial [Myxococcota bacterium]|nr:right-handed parallel beta-helix repeat-containing protein [Myxococcota bacterium]